MKFSICIPNFNYAHYLGITFESLKKLEYKDFEVVVSDNASTDTSMEAIRNSNKLFKEFHYQANPINIGFAPNLDKAASLASGDYFIMLSSDDLIDKEALTIYHLVFSLYPGVAISSAWDIIDSEGRITGRTGPNPNLWHSSDRDSELSTLIGSDVYRVKNNVLLQRCLLNMATPFNFCTAAYPKEAYVQVGGYGTSRLINPDKWFHWRLLTQVGEAVYVDKALFQYRWHNQNQTAQQTNTGYLKYMLDEYRNTIEITEEMLRIANVTRKEFVRAFIQRDIYRHGLGEYVKGRWLKSLRIYFFGLSTYPGDMILHPLFIIYSLMLLTTPLGSWVVSRFKP